MSSVDVLRLRINDPVNTGITPASEFDDDDLLVFVNEAVHQINLDAGVVLSDIIVTEDVDATMSPLIFVSAQLMVIDAKLIDMTQHLLLTDMDTTLDRRQSGQTLRGLREQLQKRYDDMLKRYFATGVCIGADGENVVMFGV